MASKKTITRSPEATRELAQKLLAELPGRTVFALHGELGSGKTCFVQGMALALGIRRRITSPTFTIANEYKAERPLYHIDLYRIRSTQEALDMGLDEYLEASGIKAIEWAERVEELIPGEAVHVRFQTLQDPDERSVTVEYADDSACRARP